MGIWVIASITFLFRWRSMASGVTEHRRKSISFAFLLNCCANSVLSGIVKWQIFGGSRANDHFLQRKLSFMLRPPRRVLIGLRELWKAVEWHTKKTRIPRLMILSCELKDFTSQRARTKNPGTSKECCQSLDSNFSVASSFGSLFKRHTHTHTAYHLALLLISSGAAGFFVRSARLITWCVSFCITFFSIV